MILLLGEETLYFRCEEKNHSQLILCRHYIKGKAYLEEHKVVDLGAEKWQKKALLITKGPYKLSSAHCSLAKLGNDERLHSMKMFFLESELEWFILLYLIAFHSDQNLMQPKENVAQELHSTSNKYLRPSNTPICSIQEKFTIKGLELFMGGTDFLNVLASL